MIAELRASHPQLPVRRLCALLGAGRTWYYTRPTAEERAIRDTALRDAIERVVLDFPGYGYRRVTKALQRAGWDVNHKRALRVMREEALLCHPKRRFVVTTDSAHGYRTYPNLLAGLPIARLDQVWVADSTYIRLPTACAYLACVLDAHSRRCRGAHLMGRATRPPGRHPPDTRRPGPCPGRAAAGTGADPPLGSRGPIRERRLHRPPRNGRLPHQHVREGESLR